MSHSYFNEKWQHAVERLNEQVEEEKREVGIIRREMKHYSMSIDLLYTTIWLVSQHLKSNLGQILKLKPVNLKLSRPVFILQFFSFQYQSMFQNKFPNMETHKDLLLLK